jgi:hypothetical protein
MTHFIQKPKWIAARTFHICFQIWVRFDVVEDLFHEDRQREDRIFLTGIY